MRHTGDKYVLEFVCPYHRVVVQNGSSCDISAQDIISDIIEGLLSGLVLIHVEGVVHFGCENALSPSLYGVDRRREILDLCLSQQPLSSDLVVSQAFSYSCQDLILPSIEDHWDILDLSFVEEPCL